MLSLLLRDSKTFLVVFFRMGFFSELSLNRSGFFVGVSFVHYLFSSSLFYKILLPLRDSVIFQNFRGFLNFEV